MSLFLTILLAISSILLIVLILAHKASGDGLSTLFGGGTQASAASTSVGSRNLNRVTLSTLAIWVATIVALGLMTQNGVS